MALDKTGRYSDPQPRVGAGVVLASVVALCFLAAAVVVGVVAFGGVDDGSTPLVVSVLGLFGATVPAILSLVKVEATRRELRNGLIPAKVHQAVEEGVKRGTLHVRVDRTGLRERATDEPRGTSNG